MLRLKIKMENIEEKNIGEKNNEEPIIIQTRNEISDLLDNKEETIFKLPEDIREIKWIDEINDMSQEIEKILSVALEKGLIGNGEKKELIKTLEFSTRELLRFDKENPLPDFHDAINHSLGGIKLVLEILIGTNISVDTIKKAIIAQSFHDLGYGKKLDLDRSHITRLGINNTHEDRSIIESIKILENLNFSRTDIDEIIYMINATKFCIDRNELENYQTIYKDEDGKENLIDITNHSKKHEIILACRALATIDIYKIEKHFIEATKKLNKEFLGDIIFLMEKLGLNNMSEYEDCFEIFEYLYSIKTNDPNDPILIKLKENDLEPTLEEIEKALEKIRNYKDENNEKPFLNEPFAKSETFQIANTKNYIDFAKDRLEKMDVLKFTKTLYKDEENPIKIQEEINKKIIDEYLKATQIIYEKFGNKIPVSVFDNEVDKIVLNGINTIYSEIYKKLKMQLK
jgi:hypothetical protein